MLTRPSATQYGFPCVFWRDIRRVVDLQRLQTVRFVQRHTLTALRTSPGDLFDPRRDGGAALYANQGD